MLQITEAELSGAARRTSINWHRSPRCCEQTRFILLLQSSALLYAAVQNQTCNFTEPFRYCTTQQDINQFTVEDFTNNANSTGTSSLLPSQNFQMLWISTEKWIMLSLHLDVGSCILIVYLIKRAERSFLERSA